MKEGTVGLDCHIIYKGKVDLFRANKFIVTLKEDTILGEAAISNEVPLLWSATAIA